MQLKDYIQGNKHGKEANRLEREAMNDPFLQDALEGFDAVPGDHAQVIERLEKRFANPTTASKNNRRLYFYLSTAASILLLVGVGVHFLFESNKINHSAIVMIPSNEKENEIQMPAIEESLSQQQETAIEAMPSARVSEPEVLKSTEPPAAMSFVQESAFADSKDEKLPLISEIIESEKLVEEIMNDETFAEYISTEQDAKMLSLSGKVVDEAGQPLPGVSILNKGTSTSVFTDMDGIYNILLSKNDSINLVASYIGYETKEITSSDTNQTITLNESPVSLDEVVVVGYGTQRKASITGAISVTEATQQSASRQTERSHTTQTTQQETKPKPFGKKEFQDYCQLNVTKDVCEGKNVSVRVSFLIDEAGKPTNINFIRYTCENAKKEIEKLLFSSPVWTTANQKVTMTIRW